MALGTKYQDQGHGGAGRFDGAVWASSPYTVTTTPGKVAEDNPGRAGIQIQNIGAERVYVGFDNSVASTKFAFKLDTDEVYFLYLGEGMYTGELWVATGSSTTQVACFEIE